MEGSIGVRMVWQENERFAVTVGDHQVTLDGESAAGLSPMQHVAAGVAGCMAIDIAHILGRMRTPPERLEVTLETERRAEPPRRFTALRLLVAVVGAVPQGNLDRAVALSRDKYCSALSSLRRDIEVSVETQISPSPPRA